MIRTTFIATLASALSAALAFNIHFIVPAIFQGKSVGKDIGGLLEFSLYASFVAFVIVLVCGIPIFFMFRQFEIASFRNLAITGFLIPATLLSYLGWPRYLGEGSSTAQYYYGETRDMIINGFPTNWRWIKYFEDIIAYGIYGLVAAVIFRKVWYFLNEA